MATRIFDRDGEYTALKGGGRGLTAQIDQVRGGIKQRPDIFISKGKNIGKTELASGYSLTGGPGKTLVDTISYKGGSTYSGGTFNVYKDAPKEEEPEEVVEEETTQEETQEEEVVEEGPDYGQMISDAMAAIPSISDITDAIRIQNEASEERLAAAREADRQLMLTMERNKRSADRTPNLQIRGAGETPQTAGSQGFRRRKDQFKIAPFQGISGIMSAVGQIAQNKLVNI